MRVLQYCTVSDRYGRHLVEEVFPDAERAVKLRSDGYSRGTFGGSDGGHCAFKLAWFQPNQFSRAYSTVGSFGAKRGIPSKEPTAASSSRPWCGASRGATSGSGSPPG